MQIESPYFETLIGLNSDYYKETWEKLQERPWSGKRFHLRAFLFAPMWLASRKMYLFASLEIIGLFFFSVLNAALSLPFTREAADSLALYSPDTEPTVPLLALIFGILYHLFIGFYAHTLYQNKIRDQYLLITTGLGNAEEQLSQMKKKGGISVLFALLFTFLMWFCIFKLPSFAQGYADWVTAPVYYY